MFTTWRETLSYVLRAGVTEGASVLVVGSGGNGLAIAAHAIELGAAEVVMVGSAAVARRVEGRLALGRFVDYRDEHGVDLLKTDYPDGFDFVFDAIGRQRVADTYLPQVRPGGVYSTYGIDEYGALSVNPGLARGRVVLHPCVYDEAETHQAVSELVLRRRLDAGLWYDREAPYDLSDIGAAFADVVERRTAPKALVRIRG
jgi:threonine dehydrogenase-like Zn-dependent dehydrogenase